MLTRWSINNSKLPRRPLTHHPSPHSSDAILLVAAAPKSVIIDTDIGSNFDDTVAIGEALMNPNISVKLILTASGDTTARAKVGTHDVHSVCVGQSN